nr:hypothetical protein [Tanacetum cinerariifolium]
MDKCCKRSWNFLQIQVFKSHQATKWPSPTMQHIKQTIWMHMTPIVMKSTQRRSPSWKTCHTMVQIILLRHKLLPAQRSIRTTNRKPPSPVYETGADDQPIVQTSQHPEWFSQPRKPPSPDRAWNTALPAAQGDAQSWISDLAKQADARSSFNELLDTLIDFSNFIMHWLNVDTLTPDLLAGPT